MAPGVALQVHDPQQETGVILTRASIPDLNDESPLPNGILDGTIVYNTNTATGPGYVYWDDPNHRWEYRDPFIGKKALFTNQFAGGDASNLNRLPENAVELEVLDKTIFNETTDLYEVIGRTRLKIKASGRYKFFLGIGFESQDGENTIETRIKISNSSGDSFPGGYYESNELQDTDSGNDDDGSVSFTEIHELQAGDEVSLISYGVQRDSDLVYLRDPEQCTFFVIKID
ncbi:hypothetical protein [Nonlabens ponticola]|uniref:Uncharacterized protein n=1 Tax=Nonlabens ponticola TaxID=2496866 RepID=A0A3S9MXF2_9FLAO|nr:hypothetical protein [Nonlabens ponticola]AZQ43809.1 hypothetical protein EJ995_06035 [Nonlabens ponticola]